MGRVRRVLAAGCCFALAFLYFITPSHEDARRRVDPLAPQASTAPEQTATTPPLISSPSPSGSPSYRMVLATIPRSGNGWLRGLLEAAAGVATMSVFPEDGAVYNAVTQAYGPDCGWLSDCAIVRAPRIGDPIIIKTHFPFTTLDNKADLLRQGLSDVGEHITYLVLPVRNVLDNHEAWVRYNRQRHGNATGFPASSLREFAALWAEHHEFWFGQGVPAFTYRYEDLVDNPLAILVRILRGSSLWRRFALGETDLLRVAGVPRLQSYRRKQMGAQTRHRDDVFNSYKKFAVDDIRWLLETYRPLLRRFGYDELYEAWLAAAAGRYNNTELEIHVRGLMRRTADTATWGEEI